MKTAHALRFGVGVALALACACTEPPQNPPPLKLHVPSPDWSQQVVYFVMTDRFANGDKSNDDLGKGEFDPANKEKYSGGDLQGIIDKLDYIQGLGATAVWITPPVANMWWDPLVGVGGYHGYWARHLKKVDEHVGTLDTYKKLSDALHQRGMYLIQDVVPNHMGNFFTYINCDQGGGNCHSAYDPACNDGYTDAACDPTKGFVRNTQAQPGGAPEQSPFDRNDVADPAQRAEGIYHWTPQISDYGKPYQQWYWQISDLDDLNTENPVVRTALRDSYGFWIKEVGVDAFRVDTAKFVPHDFWNDFFHSAATDAPGMMAVAKATGRDSFYAFGEVLETSNPGDDSADQKVAAYYGTAAKPEFPALLGYPMWSEIGRVFAQGAPTASLTYRLGKLMDRSLYPDPHIVPQFLDNHDQSRFLSVASVDSLVQAIVFLFTIPGVPVVYYGTEQGFSVTRQAMFNGGYGATRDAYNPGMGLYQIIKQLSEMRRTHKAFTAGTLDVLYDSSAGAGPFAFRRQADGDTVLVLLNSSPKNVLFSQLDSKLPAGTVLELWHSQPAANSFTAPLVGANGRVTLSLPPSAILVAHATSQVQAPPAPAAAITVNEAVDGQTFTDDKTITGTVSPASTKLVMVQDGILDGAKQITVANDGTWSVVLPVSEFPVGTETHTFAVYAPDAGVSTPLARFTSQVAFNGNVQTVDDAAGDDHGPEGKSYTYPKDPSFARQQDITKVTALVGATTLELQLTMANVTNVWSPDLGFDHVVFDVYFQVPGGSGGTNVLPKLQATAPDGFSWHFGQFTSGYANDNVFFDSTGADATHFGATKKGPRVKVNAGAKMISFVYDRNDLGLSTWTGTKVYVTTWDYDGVNKVFRPISQTGDSYVYGNGQATDPYIMDDVAPITLQGP